MKHNVWKLLCCVLLISATMLTFATVAVGDDSTMQKENSTLIVDAVPTVSNQRNDIAASLALTSAPTLSPGRRQTSVATALDREALRALRLMPGGMPFGVKFLTEGVTVVGFGEISVNGEGVSPGTAAGLRAKDVILKINGEEIRNAAHLTEAIEGCRGEQIELLCKRAGKEFNVSLKPVYSEEEARYKTGIWVRDSGAGIGTVTFILPESGAFAGLGHGICDADTGELIGMKRGAVSSVTISSVVRGAQGAPGELKGYFNAGKIGALLGNSPCGVWGVFDDPPKNTGDAMPLALRDEVEEGDAYILCTLDNNEICQYSIRISNVNREAKASKCFNVTVTDPALLRASGGIVQGMSGSPIIQNGKLIGAVTHVLINDPTTGYGIFIENMLNAAQMPMAKAS